MLTTKHHTCFSYHLNKVLSKEGKLYSATMCSELSSWNTPIRQDTNQNRIIYNPTSCDHFSCHGGGALKFQGGSEKKRSLQILDLQRLASLLYVYICTSEWGQEECWRVEPVLLKDNWESDISEHYPGNTLMREEWVTSVDKGSSNNTACHYLVLTGITNLLMFI